MAAFSPTVPRAQRDGALDLAQSPDRQLWQSPWQPRTVELVAAMRAAGADPAARIAAALRLARRSGVLEDDDIRIAGFAPPEPLALSALLT